MSNRVDLAAGNIPTSVALDPTGRFVYIGFAGGFSISSFVIDPVTGGLTKQMNVATGSDPSHFVTTP